MLREMNYREIDGVTVGLMFDTDTRQVVIFLSDVRTNLQATFPVPPECAMDAFNHPFFYLVETPSAISETGEKETRNHSFRV